MRKTRRRTKPDILVEAGSPTSHHNRELVHAARQVVREICQSLRQVFCDEGLSHLFRPGSSAGCWTLDREWYCLVEKERVEIRHRERKEVGLDATSEIDLDLARRVARSVALAGSRTEFASRVLHRLRSSVQEDQKVA